MDYLSALNENQRKAVETTEGPVMIVAGPGAGKTRVLTYKVAHLIQKGVDPFNILVLTFTNKASREMKSRIESIAGYEARNLWMGTFHSVFSRLLRKEAEKLGFPSNFTIYDTDDSKRLIKSIIKEMELSDKIYKPNLVYNRISLAKNNLIGPKTYKENLDIQLQDEASGKPRLAEVYENYSKRCFRAGAMDFDDLLFRTHDLLTRFTDVLYHYQHQFKYVLIDEYQDTNYVQYVITKKIADVFQNICVVGDDAQSIYAFRGASIKNILNFQRDYPETNVFKLEQNYRSTKIIVSAANNIIKKNKEQLQKEIWTHNVEGERIKVLRGLSDNDEGRLIANAIFEEKMKRRRQNSDFAILYRTNAQSRAFEEWLRKLNIPYRIYGGLSFYQRKEVKDFMAYLRLIVNPHDEEALKRVINYPARGIGKTTIEKIILHADSQDVSLWTVAENIKETGLSSRATTAIEDFVTLIQSLRVLEKNASAYEIAVHVAKSTGILSELHSDKTVEGVSRYENIQELLNSIKEFTEEKARIPVIEEEAFNDRLSTYLQEVSLLTSVDMADDDDNKVNLMSIHSAKGLEFPHVFVVGLEENLFPSQLSLTDRQDLEEERRLFYVSVTRAKENLTLSYAESRYRFGNLMHCEASRFIQEIDPQLLDIALPFGGRQNMSQPQERKRKTSKPAESPKYYKQVPVRREIRKVTVPDNFRSDDTSGLQAGMEVIHSKFGQGKVLSIEENSSSRIATIFFPGEGQKKIMLKYAKLQLLN